MGTHSAARSLSGQPSSSPECEPTRVDREGPRIEPHELKRDPLLAVFVAPIHAAANAGGAGGRLHGGMSRSDTRLTQSLRERLLGRSHVGFLFALFFDLQIRLTNLFHVLPLFLTCFPVVGARIPAGYSKPLEDEARIDTEGLLKALSNF